jgi:hypothetical protein
MIKPTTTRSRTMTKDQDNSLLSLQSQQQKRNPPTQHQQQNSHSTSNNLLRSDHTTHHSILRRPNSYQQALPIRTTKHQRQLQDCGRESSCHIGPNQARPRCRRHYRTQHSMDSPASSSTSYSHPSSLALQQGRSWQLHPRCSFS